MPSAPIPQEVIDNVIDYIHDDRETLTTCLQVSRQFHPRSQKHLFTTVTINYPSVPRPGCRHPAQRLLDILLADPALARHIHHFRVFGFVEGYYTNKANAVGGLHLRFISCSQPDTVYPSLFALLARHSSLRSFTFQGNPSIAQLYEENRGLLPTQNFSLLLMNMLRKTRIVELNLSRLVQFPLARVVDSAAHLKILHVQLMMCRRSDALGSVDEVKFPVPADADANSSKSNLGLDSLELDEYSLSCINYHGFYASSQARALHPFSRLQALTIYGNIVLMEGVPSKIIANAAATLKSFSWEFLREPYMPVAFNHGASLNLESAMNLRSLRFAFLNCDTVMSIYIPWVVSSLKSISKHGKLEQLDILFTIPGPSTYNHSFPDTFCQLFKQYDACASALGSLLADSCKFPALQKVHVVLEYHGYEYSWLQLHKDGRSHWRERNVDLGAVEKLGRDVREKFGMLWERGMLDFHIVRVDYACRGLKFLDRFIQ
ncbi:hypothetical protein Hypma_013235 [Hypsizygus marmoreus]|uniref:F-box domain-containing protein n=1 Tax=Hypsizygus marmoreus TaxID=39966 RepID=A0A369JEY6_HYPMA|nr:hypothetical protein Hypma_013235 [Hypsizygus marmoreus]